MTNLKWSFLFYFFFATQTAVAQLSFYKNNKAVFFFITQAISFCTAEVITLEGKLCFTRRPQTVEKVTSAYRSVFFCTTSDRHNVACSFIAWNLLLHDQTALKRLFRKTRECVSLNCTVKSELISLLCWHVSCREACLFWRRRSDLPGWYNTPAERQQSHTAI